MTERSPRQVGGPADRLVVEAVTVFAVALALRLIALRSAGMFDEYYHVLAAQAWLRNGSFGLVEGAGYERAWAFTLLVATSMRVFGETLMAARIPSLLAGSLWPVVIYLGVRRIDGRRGGAAIAAGLVALDPTLLGLSQIARFYTLHGLFFWIGVFALLGATRRQETSRYRYVQTGIAILALSAALHLQEITLIGFGGLVVGILVADSPWILGQFRRLQTKPLTWVVLGIGTIGCCLVLWASRHLVFELWTRFNWVPLWLQEQPASPRYYHWWLQRTYPLLWGLFPVAGALALLRRTRLTVVCVTAFAVVFVASSLASSQLPRYMAYALPFLFIPWGLALRDGIPWLADLARKSARSVRGPEWLGYAGLVAMLGFAALNTPAWWKTSRALNPRHPVAPYITTDWNAAAERLGTLADSVDVVMSSAGPQTLFHLGRLDFEVGATYLPGNGSGPEFEMDFRIGRPVLSTVESLELIMECFPSGLLLANEAHWGREWGVSPAMVEHVSTILEPVDLPPELHILAFRWTDLTARESTLRCQQVLP